MEPTISRGFFGTHWNFRGTVNMYTSCCLGLASVCCHTEQRPIKYLLTLTLAVAGLGWVRVW